MRIEREHLKLVGLALLAIIGFGCLVYARYRYDKWYVNMLIEPTKQELLEGKE